MIVEFTIFNGLGFGIEHVEQEIIEVFHEGAQWAVNVDFLCFRFLFIKV